MLHAFKIQSAEHVELLPQPLGSSKAHFCPSVWWGEFGAHRMILALPNSEGWRYACLITQLCLPTVETNCQPSSLLEQGLHTVNPPAAPLIPSLPARQGR